MQRTYDSLDWMVCQITKQLLGFLVLDLRAPTDFSIFCGFRSKGLDSHLGVSVITFISTRILYKDGTDSPRLLHHLISPYTCMNSLQGTKTFLPTTLLKMVFPFPKWDMLVPQSVSSLPATS